MLNGKKKVANICYAWSINTRKCVYGVKHTVINSMAQRVRAWQGARGGEGHGWGGEKKEEFSVLASCTSDRLKIFNSNKGSYVVKQNFISDDMSLLHRIFSSSDSCLIPTFLMIPFITLPSFSAADVESEKLDA